MRLLLIPDPTSPNGEDAFCREMASRAKAAGHTASIQAVPNGPLEITLEQLRGNGFADQSELVFVNSLQPAAVLAARRAEKPVWIRLIDSFYTVSPAALSEVKKLLGQAEKLLLPSRYLAGLLKEWGIPEKKMALIPYAYEKIRAREIVLLDLKSGSHHAEFPLVACLPLNESTQNSVETLFSALSRLRFDWQLFLIGDGTSLAQLKNSISKLSIAPRIVFTGALSHAQIMEYFRACKAYIDPCGKDGFPSFALYALSEGCPVVAAKAGAYPEFIQHGKNGLLFPSGEAGILAEAVVTLRAEEGMSLRLIGAGIKTVTSCSWNDTISAVFACLPHKEK